LGHRIASCLANAFKIRTATTPAAVGSMKEGEVKYTIGLDDAFLQLACLDLRSGVLDVSSQ